jgi:TPR repeat protein
VQVRFEVGAFDRALQRIGAGAASLPDVCDTNAPLSSGAAFLAEEVMSSKYLEPLVRSRMSAETAARLPGLLRLLKLEEVLQPLNQLLGKPAGAAAAEVDFFIPIDLDLVGATRSDLMGLAAGWLLRRSDELFPARSWPWTVLREASLTIQGKGKYTEPALKGIYEDGETGPLGYLTVAQVLSKYQPPLARKFAARGLERLAATDFRRDYQLFLAGDSIASQCCLRLTATLRKLDDEQLAALVKLQSPARGEFVRECVRRLRAAEAQPVLEVLAPVLDLYWEKELRDQVAHMLRRQSLDADAVFKEALALYQTLSSDKSQAAVLFQQAADQGHAGAQYYLGMIYENGAGVPKDVAAALNFYRQSATNGFPEAGMTLGNYYSDGLDAKPDYSEAFVWYRVAAAQGNRLAEAYSSGMRGKLPKLEQMAQAEQRVAAILAHRPPNAATWGPTSPDKDD